jgi:cytochrome b561
MDSAGWLTAHSSAARTKTIGAWQVSALFAPDRAFARVFELLHELGAWALLALIGLHAVAALFHALLRNEVAADAALDGALIRHN